MTEKQAEIWTGDQVEIGIEETVVIGVEIMIVVAGIVTGIMIEIVDMIERETGIIEIMNQEVDAGHVHDLGNAQGIMIATGRSMAPLYKF